MSAPRSWDPGPSLRIGDAEREAAAQALGEHFAAGRLTRDEYDERAERVWAARTVADLRPLFTDLPAPHAGTGAPRPRGAPAKPPAQAARPRAGRRLPLLPMFLIALGLVLLLDVPGAVIFLLIGAWWWTMSVRWRRHWSSRGHFVSDTSRRRGC
ncbi:MAG: DUF1707 SHOCT-like domain-containing protein [Nocardioides sp.]